MSPSAEARSNEEPYGVADEVAVALPATPDASRLARRVLTEHWSELPAAVVDDAILIVSELVSNAVQHGRPEIELRLRAGLLAVDVSVLDHGPDLPPARPPRPAACATSGRGLGIVDTVASRWGIEPLPNGRGKAVWASLAAVEGC